MAGKILNSSEAAAMLGVTEDQLVEMRQRNEIFGRRDGSTWNFKSEEVERVLAERGGGSGVMGGGFDDLLADLSSPSNPTGSGPILISEESLGRSPEGTSSTIIGKKESAKSAGDSDLQLAPEGGLAGSGIKTASGILGGSDLKLTGSGTGTGSGIKGGSDVDLGDGLELGDDELSLATESNKNFSTPPKPADDDDSDEIDLDSDSVGIGGGSVIGSGVGSDVTLRGGDSGINLKPTDSGLSLEEEPLDLGGSAVDSLELPEDDDVISLDEDAADPDQATQLKQDDQFLLSPSDAFSDDESDSGSQVIALEDSESFDSDAATMLRSAGAAPLAEDAFSAVPMDAFGGAQADGFGQAPMDSFGQVSPMGAAPAMGGQAVYVQVPVLEAPYSVWNVLGLFFVTIMMICCGMLTVDILLNMWVFESQSSMSMALMDMAIETFQLDK